jgi:hypothetical protein
VAKFAATDFTVTINGTALSTSLSSVDLTINADDKDVSTFGVGWRQHVAGLKQGQLQLNFLQDFAAARLRPRCIRCWDLSPPLSFSRPRARSPRPILPTPCRAL